MAEMKEYEEIFNLWGPRGLTNGVVPPPPPPPPSGSAVGSVSLGIAGVIIGAVTGLLIALVATTGAADAGTVKLGWWIVIGLVDGILVGAVGSMVYNFAVKRSKAMSKFYEILPKSKSLPHDLAMMYWIHDRFENFYEYVNKNFEKKK